MGDLGVGILVLPAALAVCGVGVVVESGSWPGRVLGALAAALGLGLCLLLLRLA